MTLLDSRASRMSPNQALLTVHADYIGGTHANYRKWYFAAQLNLDDAKKIERSTGTEREDSRFGAIELVQYQGLAVITESIVQFYA